MEERQLVTGVNHTRGRSRSCISLMAVHTAVVYTVYRDYTQSVLSTTIYKIKLETSAEGMARFIHKQSSIAYGHAAAAAALR